MSSSNKIYVLKWITAGTATQIQCHIPATMQTVAQKFTLLNKLHSVNAKWILYCIKELTILHNVIYWIYKFIYILNNNDVVILGKLLQNTDITQYNVYSDIIFVFLHVKTGTEGRSVELNCYLMIKKI